jgi:hypothetical protein
MLVKGHVLKSVFYFIFFILYSLHVNFYWTDKHRIVTGYGTLFYVYSQDSGEGLW